MQETSQVLQKNSTRLIKASKSQGKDAEVLEKLLQGDEPPDANEAMVFILGRHPDLTGL